MSITLKFNGVDTSFRVSTDQPHRLELVASESPEVSVCLETPLILDRAFEGKAFDIHYLTNPNIRENDAAQVICAKTGLRIGWIIPALSLVSDLHDFATNQHFLKYAYIAMRDAFKAIPRGLFTLDVDVGSQDCLRITDLFHESTAFLVVSTEQLVGECEFDLIRAAPSLIASGYLPLGVENPDRYSFCSPICSDGKLKFELSAPAVLDHELVLSLLSSFASSHRDAVLQFFYLYQIIELLIERVFSYEQKQLAQEVLDAGDDSSKIKAALEKVSETVSEKKRIQLLVDRYSKIESELGGLRAACNNLLDQLGMESGSTLVKCLYPIRNFVFHRYRSFPPSSLPALGQVSVELVSVLPKMLGRFEAVEAKTGVGVHYHAPKQGSE